MGGFFFVRSQVLLAVMAFAISEQLDSLDSPGTAEHSHAKGFLVSADQDSFFAL